MAHQDKMKEMHHKYLERKIHKIDYLDDKSSRSKSRTPPPTDL